MVKGVFEAGVEAPVAKVGAEIRSEEGNGEHEFGHVRGVHADVRAGNGAGVAAVGGMIERSNVKVAEESLHAVPETKQ